MVALDPLGNRSPAQTVGFEVDATAPVLQQLDVPQAVAGSLLSITFQTSDGPQGSGVAENECRCLASPGLCLDVAGLHLATVAAGDEMGLRSACVNGGCALRRLLQYEHGQWGPGGRVEESGTEGWTRWHAGCLGFSIVVVSASLQACACTRSCWSGTSTSPKQASDPLLYILPLTNGSL